ncbi:sugar phosphate isomerase/epimerase [Methanothermobacter sp. K4]|uniref:sugar phosphate isomerase/epimerase family protein n=1 Tax=Methanothermobacter sp. K4 TaxID=2913262 RepID=UPI001ED9FDD6|nr:sugar phosphate isomerase/epimerase [Methanothermobacter sp. K4]MCG2829156.1 sugar phosphate isomerase/epimerase [Methanothermobacter sp. K4]
MRIGVSTLALSPLSLEEMLTWIEDAGADCCEIIYEYPLDDVEVADSFSLDFTVHAPISDINIASLNRGIREASIAEVKSAVDLAVELDSEVVVVHPGSVPFLGRPHRDLIVQRNLESLSVISEYAEDRGAGIYPENMPRLEGPLLRELEELWLVADELESQVTLDAAHAATMGYSEAEMVSPRVGHVHLSDNNGEVDSHDALGDGSLDFGTIIDGLRGIGYRGILTVEVKTPGEVERSVEFLKGIIDR